MEKKTDILLIEDNPADSRLIEIYVEESFGDAARVTVANCLAKAEAFLSKQRFDIIVIDLSLPDSSGVNTFREVFQIAPETPLIVLTGNDDESVGIDTVKLGAQEFLIKGRINSSALKRSINYSIERNKLLKTLSENTKKIEEKTQALLREKYKLAQAQKLAHVGSWEWNVQENSFTCSDELYHILGLERDEAEITYQEYLAFVHPEERNFVRMTIEDSLIKMQPFDFFHRIITRQGKVNTLHARGELILDEQGSVLQVVGTAQDVTQRKKEEKLEQLAMVATKSFNAVTIADKYGRIEWVNEGFTKLFGYTLKDVRGTQGQILRKGEKTGLSPETEIYKVIVTNKRPLTYESRNFSKDGVERWVLTSLTPILDQEGKVQKIISIDSDITNQKKAEKTKEQFLTNMSHEIRTPMNAIIGFTNLLLKSKHDGETTQYLKAIKTSGENLLVIINDILDFSKLESGKVTFESISFSLPQLMHTLVLLMHPKANEKNLKLSAHIDETIPEHLTGDTTRLTQILTNLVGNAIKFTEKGEVLINVSRLNESGKFIELSFTVEDTGIGIPVENLERIFESFTQASNETTRKYGGTGLGLTITKQLIELQGGTISVSSKVNKGSIFEFRMKFKKSKGLLAASSDVHEQLEEGYPLEGTSILLVEDNSFNQILARKILEGWHCLVDIAADGGKAVECAKRKRYDLILMDIQLPEMDGYEATKQIRAAFDPEMKNVPIIAMTAHAFANEAVKCLNSGMNDYISKPFDETKLLDKILNALNKKKPGLEE